jgi:monofunctional glycosyltransferase
MARIITNRARSAQRRRRPWRRWILALVLAPLLLSVAAVGLLRWIDPPTSAFMLARQWETRAGVDYRWVDWRRLSPQLPVALVAAEDQHFPRHRGFDVDAIEAALSERGAGGPRRGASTISQQVAKNLFLWSGRSWLRKALEAWFTVWIELLWSKQRILEVYANIAEFGDGVYGAEAAAQRFFGKPASALDAAQSARLAAVLPSPRRYSATRPGAYVQQRQQWIERQVRQLGGPGYLAGCCGNGRHGGAD